MRSPNSEQKSTCTPFAFTIKLHDHKHLKETISKWAIIRIYRQYDEGPQTCIEFPSRHSSANGTK